MDAALECVINISEGRNSLILGELSEICSRSLLDVHTDIHHNRTVFTLAGSKVEADARALAAGATERLDFSHHAGVHPRLGVVDVVPFVPLPNTRATIDDALRARNEFAKWFASSCGVSCFVYGPERTLPEVRKYAYRSLRPSFGPPLPDPHKGTCAVGAREVLIAFNLWVTNISLGMARMVASGLRRDGLRVLALQVGDDIQISCNLTEPLNSHKTGPAEAYELVAERAQITRAELVGLLPEIVLARIPKSRWEALDLGPEKTIECRMAAKQA